MTAMAWVAALAIAATAGAQTPPPAAAPTPQAELDALLDGLGFVDAPELPFVAVREGSGDAARPLRHGVLLESRRDRFVVHLFDIGRSTFAIGADVPRERRATFEPADPRAVAREGAAELRRRKEDEETVWLVDDHRPLSDETRALLLARACARRGFDDVAREVRSELPPEHGSIRTIATSWTFRRDVCNRLLLDHADPSLSWQELLDRYDRALPLLAGRERMAAGREREAVAAVLERARAPEVDGATAADRLVRSLCEQCAPVRAMFDSQPLPPRAPRASYGEQPADRLVALGLDAVPALLDALRDERPTRSVWHTTKYGGHLSVEPVSAVVRSCLHRIAGGRPRHENEEAGWIEWYAVARERGVDAARVDVLGGRPGAKNVPEEQVAHVRARSGWQ